METLIRRPRTLLQSELSQGRPIHEGGLGAVGDGAGARSCSRFLTIPVRPLERPGALAKFMVRFFKVDRTP